MEGNPLNDEIRGLAHEIATSEDEDVRDSADSIARTYTQRRAMLIALLNVDLMVEGNDDPPDEYDPRLVALRVQLRDQLKALVKWAQKTGRL